MSPWLCWFLLGLALMAAEFVVPGVVLVFFGLGAWIVAALLGLGVIESLGVQLLVFASSSLTFLLAVRRFARVWFGGRIALFGMGEDLQEEFHGQSVRVLTPFAGPGSLGKVEFKGAEWNARAEEELRVGDPAEIVSVDGLTLRVRRRWLDIDV